MQAAFDVLLDPPAYNYIRNLQVKLCELFGAKETLKLEPHFTIKYAFGRDDLSTVESYFDTLVSQTQTFEITLDSINSFESKVVYMNVGKNEILKKLHLNILQALLKDFSVKPSEFEGENYNFHSTLAYKDVSEETIVKIKVYLKNETPNFTFQVKRVGMYVLLAPDQNWFIYKIGNLA